MFGLVLSAGRHRYLLKDTLQEIALVLTFERVFEIIAASIREDIERLKDNTLSNWSALEADLYSII